MRTFRACVLTTAPLPTPPVPVNTQDSLGDLDEYMAKKPPHQHMFGLSFVLRPWDMTTRFLWECKKVGELKGEGPERGGDAGRWW